MENSAKVFYQEDCDLSLLFGKTIAVIGYGSQGHAHALNAKESLGDNARVIIGLYEGSKSWDKAVKQGFEVFTAAEAAKQADIIMILINDEKQAAMYKKDIEPNLKSGDMLMFARNKGDYIEMMKNDFDMVFSKLSNRRFRSFDSNRQIMMRPDIKLPQPFASWSNSL